MSNPWIAVVGGIKYLKTVFKGDLVCTTDHTGISTLRAQLALTFTSRRWVAQKHEIHHPHLFVHIYTCTNAQVQDSLPGTRQRCAAKWDVWEPPAAKRRTGRRNKPFLMETWHARWGGNSNKRLMGHGAFSTAAKSPLLLPPVCSASL